MDTNLLLAFGLVFVVGVLVGLYLAYRLFGPGRSYSWQRHNQRYDQVIKLAIRSQDGRQGWFIELPERQLLKLKTMAGAIAAREKFKRFDLVRSRKTFQPVRI